MTTTGPTIANACATHLRQRKVSSAATAKSARKANARLKFS
jgi:hypothetical protein